MTTNERAVFDALVAVLNVCRMTLSLYADNANGQPVGSIFSNNPRPAIEALEVIRKAMTMLIKAGLA